MNSRAERERLDTIESRKDSLTIYIDHKDWIPTPYISFTTSPSKIEGLVNLRAQRRNRGPHTLTIVNPSTRVRNGLPVLHVADEMDHYGIADPYGKLKEYYKDHYVRLWEVTTRETVGQWQWDDLVGHENWYQEIIMPAFQRAGRQVVEEDSLSNLFARLSCMFMVCIKTTRLTKEFKSQPIPPTQSISSAVQNWRAAVRW